MWSPSEPPRRRRVPAVTWGKGLVIVGVILATATVGAALVGLVSFSLGLVLGLMRASFGVGYGLISG